MKERFGNHFNTSRTEADENMQVLQKYFTEEVAPEGIIAQVYRVTRDGTLTKERMDFTM